MSEITFEDILEAKRKIFEQAGQPPLHPRPPAILGHDCPLCFDPVILRDGSELG